MRSCRTLKPAIALSASRIAAFDSRSMPVSRFQAITGSITFSWKLPLAAAKPIAASQPITCAPTIATDSGITGLTLPGMIDEPGCKAGSSISPSPASGPEFIQRRSFAILVRTTAAPRNTPDNSTAASWPAMP